MDEVEAAAEAVREELAPRHLLGCVAEGVVAGVRELEQGPALAVWAGALPGAEIECFHAAGVQTEDEIAVAGFPELDDPALVALLVDPFTFPAGPLLTSLNEAYERVRSWAGSPRSQRLWIGHLATWVKSDDVRPRSRLVGLRRARYKG